MFDKLKEKIENQFLYEKTVNVFSFGDPVAEKIEWTPLKKDGSRFRTQQVKAIGPGRIEIVPTIGVIVLRLLMIVVELGVAAVLFHSLLTDFQLHNSYVIWIIILALFASAFFGILVFAKLFKKHIFDKQTGYYWVGKKGPRQTYDFHKDKRFIELKQIHALQIIKERVQTSKGSYDSYELNLVLKDLRRINVMNYGKLNKLRTDADSLSRFLNVTVWDAIP